MAEFSLPEHARAFESYGRAVGAAQHLETLVAELLALKTMPDVAAGKDEEWVFVIRELLKMETDMIVESFVEYYSVPPDLANRLKQAIGLRDALVRRYLWEKAERIYTAEGNREMQADCDRVFHLFNALSADVYSYAQERMPSLKKAAKFISRLLNR